MDLACAAIMCLSEEPHSSTRKWYFSREEIEYHSPSRKDGIELGREEQFRKSYCSFLQELGMKLKVPQVAIACAMMLCHRFYMRQSHAKNDWQTIATVSTFLACKIEETPRLLRDVIVVSYEIIHKRDPSAPGRIRQIEVYDKQKELILVGERLLLAAIAFDLDIELPYKPLVAAFKKLEIFPNLLKVAWNFVNDWLHTTLCLQYKPHYIAAGSMCLAAKFQKVKLPIEKGKVWWLEFDISPKQLQEVTQQMVRLLEQDKSRALSSRHERASQSACLAGKSQSQFVAGAENSKVGKSMDSCVSQVRVKQVFPYQANDIGASSVVEDGNDKDQPRTEESDQNPSFKTVSSVACDNKQVSPKESLPSQTSDSGASTVVDSGEGECGLRTEERPLNASVKIVSVHNTFSKIDADRIRETFKRRRCDRAANFKCVEIRDDEVDSEAWIERELEIGIELESASSQKRERAR
ncbi:cyclin-T1-3-like isoform X1 [Hibiscus syriacus]|uniref:cyclin-T1-3-like isoform X1 n=1 Tax=Hibiscus syriacus TaxID=106335 RepID=UPI0019226A00|nr:cyclin-T1-3-like isoform X1 [Hibiscus syriacus]